MKALFCLIVISSIFFGGEPVETGLAELSINAWTSLFLSCLFLLISHQKWATILALAESVLVVYSVMLHYMLSNYIYVEFVYQYYPTAQTVVYFLEIVVLGRLMLQGLRYDSRNDSDPRNSTDSMDFCL